MVWIHAVNRSDVSPLELPSRLRTEITYFMTPGDQPGSPKLGTGEYWVRLSDARRWLDDFVFELVSPLDASVKAECELSEDQERLLEWLVEHEVEHLRLSDTAA